jgi:signal transduction histidine kinase
MRQTNGAVEVIVDDNGSGIPAAERQAVFTAFHRTESSRNRTAGGTGLGLAIALGIIERQHGGSIEIDDAPGRDARLRISVPGIMGGRLPPEAL